MSEKTIEIVLTEDEICYILSCLDIDTPIETPLDRTIYNKLVVACKELGLEE